VDEDVAADALNELRKNDLLTVEPQAIQSTVLGVSRREAISRGVRYGVAVAAVPMIVSATAATPAMASSGEPACALAGESETCCICRDDKGKNISCHPKETREDCEKTCEEVELKSFFLPGFNCA
jgi:hypothetical protein